MQLLEFNNSTKVLDINLRPPHYEKESIEKLLYKADVLKLNDHELKLIAGWYKDYTDVASQLAFLQQKFEVPTLLVTLGDKGAMLKKGDNTFHHKGYPVNVCDTIGSGDAFLAGYLYTSA
jgi:fructokinase